MRTPHKCDICNETTDMIEIGYICVPCKLVYDLDAEPWFDVPGLEQAEQVLKEYNLNPMVKEAI